MTDEGRFVRLSWKLIEYKAMYYRPNLVHESWHGALTVSDERYDALELRYLGLCRELNRPNTVVHTERPGFKDLGVGMMEIDEDRPSVQLVLEKLARAMPPCDLID